VKHIILFSRSREGSSRKSPSSRLSISEMDPVLTKHFQAGEGIPSFCLKMKQFFRIPRSRWPRIFCEIRKPSEEAPVARSETSQEPPKGLRVPFLELPHLGCEKVEFEKIISLTRSLLLGLAGAFRWTSALTPKSLEWISFLPKELFSGQSNTFQSVLGHPNPRETEIALILNRREWFLSLFWNVSFKFQALFFREKTRLSLNKLETIRGSHEYSNLC